MNCPGYLAVLDHPGLAGAGFRGGLLVRSTCANSATLLIVAPGPADIRHGDHGDARLRPPAR